MPFRIDVDQQFGVGKLHQQIGLHPFNDVMCLCHTHLPRQIDMELHKIVVAADPCAQIVEPSQLWMARRRRDEGLPLLLRPFAVHQMVQRIACPAIGAPQQPGRNRQPEQRIGAGKSQILIQRQRRDHRQIKQQV